MFKAILWVGLGGFLGSIGRYLTGLLFTDPGSGSFPWGTFAANILGCFLVVLFYGLSRQYDWFDSYLSLLLIVGFCGGFTTFSSFAYENITLLQEGNYAIFILYSSISFVTGLLAVVGGMMIIR